MLFALSTTIFAAPAGPGNNKIDNCAEQIKVQVEAVHMLKSMEDSRKNLEMINEYRSSPENYSNEQISQMEEEVKSEIEQVREEISLARDEKKKLSSATGFLFNRESRIKAITKKIDDLHKKLSDLFLKRNGIVDQRKIYNLGTKPFYQAPRLTTTKVKLLEGEELEEHYENHPGQRSLDTTNNYKRYLVKTSKFYDDKSEQDLKGLSSEKSSINGVVISTQVMIVDEENQSKCRLRRIMEVD